MRTINLLVLIICFQYAKAQWSNNAGIVPSLLENAIVTASSGENPAYLTDKNPDTSWESENPLPVGYLTQKQLNLLLNKDSYMVVPEVSTYLSFDGNTDTKASITNKKLSIQLTPAKNISWAHIKINTSETVHITLIGKNGQQEFTFSPEENYQIKSLELDPENLISEIILTSNSPYELFELGLLGGKPTEYVEFDLGNTTSVGWVSTRHFNGDGVTSIELLASKDGKNWFRISTLDPQATALIPHTIQPEIQIRYLRIEFTLQPRPYQKAKLMEVAAYDKFGPFGPPEKAQPAKRSFSNSMGINSFWGWGYSVYSDLLIENQGPNIFIQVADLARNYHRIDWDIENPQTPTNFATKEFKTGTSGSQWMNWNREYLNWKNAGFSIDAAITFDKATFSDKVWQKPEKEAFDYGIAFAQYFVNQKQLISTIEIGNEPWEYDGQIYRQVLIGLSSGIKSVSPNTMVLPCAVQAFDPGLSLNNYVSKYVSAREAQHLDGLNTHIYSYYFEPDGKRRAINPEDRRSEIWSMNNLARFRDANMPNKIIAVTEFGFDSWGGNEDCTHDECISEMEQALYGTRMALMLYRLGAESFYWYFFANVDYQSMLHNRSGLTASYSGGFAKKLSFEAFKKLKEKIGNYYFFDIVIENEDAYVYAYTDPQGKVKKLIAWRPTAKNHFKTAWVDIPWKTSNINAEYLVPTENENQPTPSYSLQPNVIRIALSGNPVIITLKE